ncbi:MAG: sulfite exporter TauE/SafE family protein [Devosiaceae bacterium]|nr:sulfite exporter TauE/SafE family protein [Devosiaceae bacterium MH13]
MAGLEASLLTYLPEGLSFAAALVLVATSFVTAALTAAFGIGGGVALLAVMASLVPVAVLIPVHGVVQLGANAGRAMVQIRQVVWPLLGIFSAGALLGALIGGQLVVTLPDVLLKTFVGAFVLLTIWGPKPKQAKGGNLGLFSGGVFATILTMFVGATGPFVAALLASRLDDRRTYAGTHAAAMVLQHGLKVIVFGFLGFAFGAWVPILVAMIGAGFLGTLLGTRLLHAIDEKTFRTAFKWLLTALSLQLIGTALWDWLSG